MIPTFWRKTRPEKVTPDSAEDSPVTSIRFTDIVETVPAVLIVPVIVTPYTVLFPGKVTNFERDAEKL
jgi:hypothetical protein